MSDTPAYFLVPASSGLCIEQRSNGIFTDSVDGKKEQQWHLQSGEGSKVAFQNLSSGGYLRALGGSKAAKVGVGKKQFFTLERSSTPNAFWIKCDDYPNAYLCNSYGAYTRNNLIYVWAHEPYYTQTMLWYLADLESWKEQKQMDPANIIAQYAASGKQFTSDLRLKQEMVGTRERDLDVRQRELEEREEAMAQKQKQLERSAAKQRDLESAYKSQGSHGGAKSEEVANEIEALQRQLADTQSKLEKSQRSQANLRARVDELSSREQEIALGYAKFQDDHDGDGKGEGIAARRLQPDVKEVEAASVGLRNAPPGLRTNKRPLSTQRNRVRPIVMPQKFSHLPRLTS